MAELRIILGKEAYLDAGRSAHVPRRIGAGRDFVLQKASFVLASPMTVGSRTALAMRPPGPDAIGSCGWARNKVPCLVSWGEIATLRRWRNLTLGSPLRG